MCNRAEWSSSIALLFLWRFKDNCESGLTYPVFHPARDAYSHAFESVVSCERGHSAGDTDANASRNLGDWRIRASRATFAFPWHCRH
jgi:hypothetical protein